MFCKALLALAIAGSLCAAEPEPPRQTEVRIELQSPIDYQVVQRATRAQGRILIAGIVSWQSKETAAPDTLEVRLLGTSPFGDVSGQWQPLPFDARVAAFRAELVLAAGGWYRMEIRASRNGTPVGNLAVEHVGVGEVFAIVGQSNSANYGEERQNTVTKLAAAFDGAAWRLANDPQPGASGGMGSFIPSFGDEMAAHFKVPIGIVAMGVGATSVREWLPPGAPISSLPTLTPNVATTGSNQWAAIGNIFSNFTGRLKQLGPNGFRAILWHQGESDANQADPSRTLSGKLYREDLATLIQESRKAIGWEVPWFVAQVSYHGPRDLSSPDIRAAQKALWDEGLALEGPDTDSLTGQMREKNGAGIHLSAKGLVEHGRMWAAKVSPWLEAQLERTSP